MSEPRLSIGIPTYHADRAQQLGQAIDSVLRGTVPACVVVADQGHTDEVAQVMRRYENHPNVAHMPTEVDHLWANWRAVAEACTTEFFAWLQDDDVIGRGYAARVARAFDRHPSALHWQARCQLAVNDRLGLPFAGNFPWVPMRSLEGEPDCWPGAVLAPTMYLTSWSLSPGVAFRCGESFSEALEAIPSYCDLFTERLILAEMGNRGDFIADPVLAGYWIHHGRNESYRQRLDQAPQSRILVDHLDAMLDESPKWRDQFLQWALVMPPDNLGAWSKVKELELSRHRDAIVAVLDDATATLSGSVQAHVPAEPEPVLLFD